MKQTGKIEIDHRIQYLRHILVYGDGHNLLYRVSDSAPYKRAKPEYIYKMLLATAKEALNNWKAAGHLLGPGAMFHPQTAFIYKRRMTEVIPTKHIISLGTGVQSSTIALMAETDR